MRIVIEATDDAADLARARECIDAMLTQRGPKSSAGASIDALALSHRARNALMSANVLTIADLCRCSRDDLLRLRSFGRTSLNEVCAALAAHGLSLHDGEPD